MKGAKCPTTQKQHGCELVDLTLSPTKNLEGFGDGISGIEITSPLYEKLLGVLYVPNPQMNPIWFLTSL